MTINVNLCVVIWKQLLGWGAGSWNKKHPLTDIILFWDLGHEGLHLFSVGDPKPMSILTVVRESVGFKELMKLKGESPKELEGALKWSD